jgi:quercetin dioxygenase-like cupin family protein
MSTATPRLRPHPADRFAGEAHHIELTAALAKLRAEPHEGKDGHRQITIIRKGEFSVVLFAFDAGGYLAAHQAPGIVVMHILRGTVAVKTPDALHEMGVGQMLLLDPDVEHDIEAREESDLLLTVSLVR